MRSFLLLLLLTMPALGQYASNLALHKTNFLIGESVLATLTITNRSGADVIVGGVGSRPWLQFQFQTAEGQQLPPVSVGAREQITLRAGATSRHVVEIEGASSTSSVGTYYTTASIYHPLSGQYYATNRARIVVTDAKPMFDEAFGVPQGYPNAGRARRYQAIIFRDVDSIQFYTRIVDERTREYLATQYLGPIAASLQPQITIDRQNKLQVLFMAQQRVFCHTTINPDGKLARRTYYLNEEGGTRPTLVTTPKGVAVVGGRAFDPANPPKDANSGIRKVSERPKGL
ncbi:MAG: hypothetical protein HS117_09055 [Verrucomicrobiaceae bacterium]|jgi:hypothetical protein|nr:hypothetical protein [Verrucomicrobiaceae bacterium]